jgi:hypothetical protein
MKRHARSACGAVLLLAFAPLNAASAADRWEEAASGAVAILPAPSEAKGLTGGSLYCAEQKWSFLFRVEDSTDLGGDARIGLEGEVFDVTAIAAPGTLDVAIPLEMIDLLKHGSRLRFEAGPKEAGAHGTFSLRNSTKVIEAIAPRCSQIDMSAYQAVALLEDGPAVETARALFVDEIRLFRKATGKQPTVSAIQIDLVQSKRLLFGALCGSNSYYGASGCTLSGWASMNAGTDWQQVYSTEGLRLYLDEAGANDGWPKLATLPFVNGTEIGHWRWSGSGYEAEGTHIAVEGDEAQEIPETVQ